MALVVNEASLWDKAHEACEKARIDLQYAELVEKYPFKGWPKIPPLNRLIVVTEKLDGTNAQVRVYPDGTVLAGSGDRWLTPERDSFGFARWVKGHEAELREGLGEGVHFGEWWGAGIGRGYGLASVLGYPERYFSLFDVDLWSNVGTRTRPACCHVVPMMYSGDFDGPFRWSMTDGAVGGCLRWLEQNGSKAAPGFRRPEGVVVYHRGTGTRWKAFCEGDVK